MAIDHKEYDSEIRVYYQEEVADQFVDRIIENLERDNASATDFKLVKGDSAQSRVFKWQYQDQVYYIKSQAPREISKLIKNIFRPVEARRHFKLTQKLLQANIPAPKPVVGITVDRRLFVTDSIFVTEEIKGVDLDRYLQDDSYNQAELRKDIIEEIARLWAQVINHGFLHQDPCLENFKLDPTANKAEIKLVDIDNIYSLPFLPKKVMLNNLAKLRARQLTDFVKTDTQPLTEEELSLFCKTFIENYKQNLALAKLQEKVIDLTIKRLLKYNSKDLILNNHHLARIYSNNYTV